MGRVTELGCEIIVGRYALYREIAAGGMATVHMARMMGEVGFARTVAVKRLHPHYARDPEFVSMFLDEARLASRIKHPNVVAVLDVVAMQRELFLVMEYVHGQSFSRLLKAAAQAGEKPSPRIIAAVMVGVLHGLHAAHDATDERGEPLNIVHRDISPHNIMVGADGVARVLDFGIAKASSRLQNTRDGQLKGKLTYMAPEQLKSETVDRRTDVYAASVVLWEALAGRKMYQGEDDGAILMQIIAGPTVPPSAHNPAVSPELDALVMKGLALDPGERFASVLALAIALEDLVGVATQRELSAWVTRLAAEHLATCAEEIKHIESLSAVALTSAMVDKITSSDAPVSARGATKASVSPERSASREAPTVASQRGEQKPALPMGALLGMSVLSAVLAVGVLVFALTRSSRSDAPAAASVSAVVTAPVAPEASATATATPSVAPPAASHEAASPSASQAPHAPAPAARAPGREKPAAAPAKGADADCSNPFYFDAQGVKRVRPQCLPH